MTKTKMLLMGALFLGLQSWGADITWDAPRNISEANDMTSLTVISALNAGGNAVTWEGIDFTADEGHGNDFFSFGPTASKYPNFISGMPFPRLDDSKQTVIHSANWGASLLIVSNLTVGSEYTLQVWSSDARGGQLSLRTQTLEAGNSVTLRQSTYQTTGSYGQYVLGTFTADSTNQNVVLSATGSDDDSDVTINAVVLYDGTATFDTPPTTPGAVTTIAWDEYARPIAGASDLLTQTPLNAVTAGGSSDVTLGTVLFKADGTANNITILGSQGSGLVPGPQGSTDPVVSQEMVDILDAARTNAAGILLSGLSAGLDYTVQIWVDDSRATAEFNTSNIGTTTTTLRHNMKAVENSLGQYILGTFTAASDVQIVAVGGNAPIVNAVAVYNGTVAFDPNPPTELPVPSQKTNWEPPLNISGFTDIIQDQTLVKALNVGRNATNDVTVNGITFAPDDGTVSGGKYYGFDGKMDDTWRADNPNYAKILASARYNSITMHLPTLTIGKTYTLQIWVNDARNNKTGRTSSFLLEGANSEMVYESIESNGFLGQYIICVFKAESEKPTVTVLGFNNGTPKQDAALVNAYALYEGAPKGDNLFDNWIGDYGLSGADAEQTADPDGDGLNNLYEYGLGGDPTDPANKGTSPTYETQSDAFQYVYPARTDDADIVYYLEIKDDLILGTWTNSGYTAVSGPSGTPDWNSVTNTIPTDAAKQFIRLMIEHP